MSYRRIRDYHQMDKKYCPEPYSHKSYGETAALDCIQHLEVDLQPILFEEVETALAAPKMGSK